MNRTLELQQKKATALDNAGAILSKLQTENRDVMAAEERASFEQFTREAQDVTDTLSAMDKLTSLNGNIPNDKTRAAKPAAGLTVHENWRDMPTLFGPAARGSETDKDRRDRMTIGFGEQLVAIKNAELIRTSGVPAEVDKRLFELQERAASGSSETVPADGGFLIQPDFSDEILMLAHNVGNVFTRARRLQFGPTSNALRIPAIDEQSRVDGSRWGGVRMFWENEADALTASKPKFNLVELVAKKLTGLYYATSELLADTRQLGALVMQAFGEEYAFKLDDGCIRGTGAGQLLGILNAAALVTVAKAASQGSKTLVYQNIQNMWARLMPRSRPNAVWFVNQDTEQQLFTLFINGATDGGTATGGVPVYVPPGGASQLPYGTIYGRPVIVIEQCETLGTAGDILLVDMGQYLLADKGDLQTAVSMHVRFLNDEQTFRWIYRADGQPWIKTALTPFKGANTLSPFVALAAR